AALNTWKITLNSPQTRGIWRARVVGPALGTLVAVEPRQRSWLTGCLRRGTLSRFNVGTLATLALRQWFRSKPGAELKEIRHATLDPRLLHHRSDCCLLRVCGPRRRRSQHREDPVRRLPDPRRDQPADGPPHDGLGLVA